MQSRHYTNQKKRQFVPKDNNKWKRKRLCSEKV